MGFRAPLDEVAYPELRLVKFSLTGHVLLRIGISHCIYDVVNNFQNLRGRDNDGRVVHVYNSSFALIVDDHHLTDIIFSESLFLAQNEPTKWKFGRLFLYQNKHAARSLFGDNIYERRFEHWEVYSGDFKYDLCFNELNGELLLTSYALNIF